MEYLALNVYSWSGEHQDRLLAEALGPAARELRAEGTARRFWFQRYDARGPHVFAVFGAEPGAAGEVGRRVQERVEAYLREHPCTDVLPTDELESRHAQCRGRTLCAIDGEPGIAPPNTVRLLPHPPGAYPMGMAAGHPREEALWEVMEEVSRWSLAELEAGTPTGGAVRWIAAVDVALRRAGEPAEAYWRHYAGTLLLNLPALLEADEAGVRATLAAGIGEKNRATFGRAWAGAGEGAEAGPAGRLAALLALPEIPPPARWHLLRDLNHGVLAQLGQTVRLRLPLVLHAWLHGADPVEAPC